MTKEGTPAAGIGRESQALDPERSAAACRRVRSVASVSAACSIVVNCLSCSIAGIVDGSSVGHGHSFQSTVRMICRLHSVFCTFEDLFALG